MDTIKKDSEGLEFEFYSATFEAGEVPDTYMVYITGINENGFTSVDSNFVNLRQQMNRVKIIHDMGFRIPPESFKEFRKHRLSETDGMTFLVTRRR